MKKEETKQFIKGVERLVKPIDVTAIAFFNTFNRLLPIWFQKKLMKKTAKQIPHMGFVVEPYSTFLCYPIADCDAAQQLLSDDYRLIKTKIFADDKPQYYIIFGCFTAHTSAFWGTRIEMYVIAENKNTGLLTWVIVDYDTNTNSYDPARGLIAANSTDTIMTSTYDGRVLVDMKRDDDSRQLAVEVDTATGTMAPLDQRLWLEGNLSVDYGKELSDTQSQPFSLTFDPKEVQQALSIPAKTVLVEVNNWYPGLFTSMPTQVVCFPYAQHFVTDSYAPTNIVTNKKELEKAVHLLGDLQHMSGFSAKPLKRQLLIGMVFSGVLTMGLLAYTIVDFLTT